MNTTKPVCGCGRTATAGYLCADCSKQLSTDLGRLRSYLPELTTLLTRQVATSRSTTRPVNTEDLVQIEEAEQRAIPAHLRTKHSTIALVAHSTPFDAQAAEMLGEARTVLGDICRARGANFNALIGAA